MKIGSFLYMYFYFLVESPNTNDNMIFPATQKQHNHPNGEGAFASNVFGDPKPPSGPKEAGP